VENPEWRPISAETKAIIDKLLLERMSLAGIRRVVGVSEQWLQDYVNAKYEVQPQVADVPAQKKDGLSWRQMSCGHLSAAKITRSGCGSPLTLRHA
jgi:hypothetical protein